MMSDIVVQTFSPFRNPAISNCGPGRNTYSNYLLLIVSLQVIVGWDEQRRTGSMTWFVKDLDFCQTLFPRGLRGTELRSARLWSVNQVSLLRSSEGAQWFAQKLTLFLRGIKAACPIEHQFSDWKEHPRMRNIRCVLFFLNIKMLLILFLSSALLLGPIIHAENVENVKATDSSRPARQYWPAIVAPSVRPMLYNLPWWSSYVPRYYPSYTFQRPSSQMGMI